jgi:hypothetical protein
MMPLPLERVEQIRSVLLDLIEAFPKEWETAKVEWIDMQANPDNFEQADDKADMNMAESFFMEVFARSGASDIALQAITKIFDQETAK